MHYNIPCGIYSDFSGTANPQTTSHPGYPLTTSSGSTTEVDYSTVFGSNANYSFLSWINETYPVMFAVIGGTALIVDSVIDDPFDFLYNTENCTVIHNERMENISEISRLSIDCGSFELLDEFNVSHSMSAEVTEYVAFMSASQISIEPKSLDYYPGLNMEFNYSVMDRMGNIIQNETLDNETDIQLIGGSFATSLTISAGGVCVNCEEGVMFSDLSISGDVGSEYTLELSSDNDQLVLAQSELTFNITGCPIRYGADSNNLTV